jgi:hypothetical protein
MKTIAIVTAALLTLCAVSSARADEAAPEPPVCVAADAQLAEASTANAKLKEATAAIKDVDDEILALRQMIAREKSNPAGVVNLRTLHSLGEDLRQRIEARPELVAERAACDREVKRLIALATKSVKACTAARKATAAASQKQSS